MKFSSNFHLFVPTRRKINLKINIPKKLKSLKRGSKKFLISEND